MEKKIIPNDILLSSAEELLAEGRDVELMVKGYSMRPYLETEKDSILLRKMESLEVGDIVLARVAPKCYVVHRVWSIEGNKVTLMGDGNISGKEYCTKEDILGTVVLLLKANGKKISPGKGRVWRFFLPVRRYILFAHKCLRKIKDLL